MIGAQFITLENVNVMSRHGRGLLCVAMKGERLNALHRLLKACLHAPGGTRHLSTARGRTAAGGEPVRVLFHSECLTGDVFASSRCDCGGQLQMAMEPIAAEGRGVGLSNKLHAYFLQDQGLDTVWVNERFRFDTYYGFFIGFPSGRDAHQLASTIHAPANQEHV